MRRALIAAALALAVAGCDLGFEPGSSRYQGRYSYTGHVDGTSRYNIVGTLRLEQVYRDEALVTIDWRYREGSHELLAIRSDRPARAYVDRDGWITFEFEGEFRHEGRWVPFELFHDGRIRGRTITGDWFLWTGLGVRGTEETGRFTARR